MYRRILVPVDGSATSMQGLREAVRLAADQSARLHVLNVVDELILAQSLDAFGMSNTGDLIEGLREAGRKALAEATALTRRHGVKADIRMLDSRTLRVCDVIVGEAKKWRADLIVMGTHGKRGLTRMLLGSDAEGVLRNTPVPVLLVRATAQRKAARGRSR
jgi:nucleotide-binding universal stress UspA family protein